MRDLTDPRWIKLKGILFAIMGLMASGILLFRSPSVPTALLLLIAVWSFCRAYYFAFYVIEKYVDPSFRFSGLIDFAKYWFWARK
jgi:hypothetical protein